MNKSTLKNTLSGFVTLAIAFVAVSTVAFAQTTFSDPSSAAPGGNIAPPVTAGSTFQQVNGTVVTPSAGATNGFVLQGAGTATSAWDLQYSTTQVNANLLTTLNTQKLCLGSTCISSLGSVVPSADVYLNSASCNNGACNTNAATALEICQNYGYSHVANSIGGGNGNNVTDCTWNGTAWSCSSGCQSSCSASEMQRVSCDDNP